MNFLSEPRIAALLVPLIWFLAVSAAVAEPPYHIEWNTQLGGSGDDRGASVAVDAHGNSYLSGTTAGSFGGTTNLGLGDTYLAKYDSQGVQIWARLLGSSQYDQSYAVAVDSLENAYVGGSTTGNLGGQVNAGSDDASLAKFDASGNVVWVRLIGTSTFDQSRGTAVDTAGNPYIAGTSYGNFGGSPNAGLEDAFVCKYDTSGNLIWSRLLGTPQADISESVAVDGQGNAYITGISFGNFGGEVNHGKLDAFLTKLSADGNVLWSRSIGSAEDEFGFSVAADAVGNAYVTGLTRGNLDGQVNAGLEDAFLVKYDPLGNRLWTRLLGTNSTDQGEGVAVDTDGNAYISGVTFGNLDGQVNAGNGDAFLAKYDSSGTLLWTRLFGSPNGEDSRAVAALSPGAAFIGGDANTVSSPSVNSAFIVKFVEEPVPEPNSVVLATLATSLSFLAKWPRQRRKTR